ncbi:ribosomal RNA small subunit methyltransferase E [Spirochaetia bacterium]|nr:ribosomal RNA small subunit methyltransferase E [Spirochaetia bacterium]
MKRFILPQPPDPHGFIRLSGQDYHYLIRVRRLKNGALFPALLPGGTEVQVRVHSTDGDTLVGECLTADQRCQAPIPPILLFQALPKGTKMDLIVRQAAEGGITEIVPFASEHSIPKIQGGGEEKLRRWERIVREARQQSGSGIATAVHVPLDIDGLLAYWDSIKSGRPGSLGLFFHQDPVDEGSLHGYLGNRPELIGMAVGPEGGFSPAEVSRFLAAGFKPIKIGDTILRTETAALYGAAAIRIILLESASWTHSPQ